MQAGCYLTEDGVVRDAFERHRRAQQSPYAPATRPEEPNSQDFQRRVLAAGIISEIKPPITDLAPCRNRQDVPVQGEPLSETVIRARR